MISEVHRTALIVDDHATFRDPARALLEVGGFVVVGEAADGLRALAEVELLAPTLSCSTSNFPSSTGLPSPSGLPPRHLEDRLVYLQRRCGAIQWTATAVYV